MGLPNDFEDELEGIVHAKRLSASKVTKLTELALKYVEFDTDMVSLLYRTHISLPPPKKISSLYVFDALSRAAQTKVIKHNPPPDSVVGNYATFLAKIEALLDSVVRDMSLTGVSECKEKTRKILDIWTKGKTFPEATLLPLKSILADSEPKERTSASNVTSDPRIAPASKRSSTTPSSTPPQPPANAPAGADPSTVLAMLQKAGSVQDAATSPVNEAQQQLLQQLMQVAQSHTPTPPPINNVPVPRSAIDPSTIPSPNPVANAPISGAPLHSVQRVRDYGDRSAGPNVLATASDPRRARDPRQQIGREPRVRDSRSRSPPSRSGIRRDVRPYSPPHRPSMEKLKHNDTSTLERAENRPEITQTQPCNTVAVPMPLINGGAMNRNGVASAGRIAAGLEAFVPQMFDGSSPEAWSELGRMWQVTHKYAPTQNELLEFVMISMMQGTVSQSLW
ncbi:hypothetical protein CYLTODRAFT_419686 [Cylindrobasidium torrendii FP15055 ss-10]|uniref:CID domain-containing protein n=1 Tax=Cylindrobasidium torrendii FP15055 ss-10 TaxID=1314674 RepID=A0A0D7BK30_9AGAR|nr:hypothetical protein CYLTODRAFT_419686 [Cylindrobasidium torrendii FP15055 ss-10]